MQREVEPALARGAVVISDRWYHSSLAYQGTEEERAWILAINGRARAPDLTLILQVEPEVAAARRRAAGRARELFDDRDAQARVAAGYEAVLSELVDRGRNRARAERAPDLAFTTSTSPILSSSTSSSKITGSS